MDDEGGEDELKNQPDDDKTPIDRAAVFAEEDGDSCEDGDSEETAQDFQERVGGHLANMAVGMRNGNSICRGRNAGRNSKTDGDCRGNLAAESLRGSFAEHLAVANGETPEFGKAIFQSDVGHTVRVFIGVQ